MPRVDDRCRAKCYASLHPPDLGAHAGHLGVALGVFALEHMVHDRDRLIVQRLLLRQAAIVQRQLRRGVAERGHDLRHCRAVLGEHNAGIFAQAVRGILAIAVGDQHVFDPMPKRVARVRLLPFVGQDVVVHALVFASSSRSFFGALIHMSLPVFCCTMRKCVPL